MTPAFLEGGKEERGRVAHPAWLAGASESARGSLTQEAMPKSGGCAALRHEVPRKEARKCLHLWFPDVSCSGTGSPGPSHWVGLPAPQETLETLIRRTTSEVCGNGLGGGRRAREMNQEAGAIIWVGGECDSLRSSGGGGQCPEVLQKTEPVGYTHIYI